MSHSYIKSLMCAAISAITVLSVVPASAVTITADYSNLSAVYQDSTGVLFASAGFGLTDVTDIFKSDVTAGLNYLSSAILLPWSTTISFQLADLKASNAVGDAEITKYDTNNRASNSLIRVDRGNQKFFLDSTPTTNTEFSMTTTNASLGGGLVNVSRFGQATPGGPANGMYDFVTLIVHETEHSLGFFDGSPRFIAAVGATNSAPNAPDRMLTVPTYLSGLLSSYQVPFLPGESHIDGVVNGGVFNNTVVATPGFGSSQRALPTDLELEALCVVNGCTTSDLNLAMTSVPEPSNLALLLAGLPLLIGFGRRRKPMEA